MISCNYNYPLESRCLNTHTSFLLSHHIIRRSFLDQHVVRASYLLDRHVFSL